MFDHDFNAARVKCDIGVPELRNKKLLNSNQTYGTSFRASHNETVKYKIC